MVAVPTIAGNMDELGRGYYLDSIEPLGEKLDDIGMTPACHKIASTAAGHLEHSVNQGC